MNAYSRKEYLKTKKRLQRIADEICEVLRELVKLSTDKDFPEHLNEESLSDLIIRFSFLKQTEETITGVLKKLALTMKEREEQNKSPELLANIHLTALKAMQDY